VAAGSGDFECALGDMLAADIFEIEGELLELGQEFVGIVAKWSGFDGTEGGGVEQLADLEQGVDGVDVDALDDGGLAGVRAFSQ
jgi:hypothetical protein